MFTARNFWLSREGQVTERYTKAIEQLGSKELDVRIGGIFALERIARDSVRDHPTVTEVLTAFIREHSREPWPPGDHAASPEERPDRPDVQAAVTVVGRRDAKRDIRPIDLTGADLIGARLDGADLVDARLRGADLILAFLRGADLRGAYLEGADLRRANLGGADLRGTHLFDADLRGASLRDARLGDANLTAALWPENAPVPEGWKRDTSSGRLEAGSG